ncbi:MAG: hypothetical protein ACREVV_09875 [Steroidobacteraceae bacterium]
MGLVLNLILQTIVWFGFLGAIIFVAAGTTDYPGGWLYLGLMVALSVVFGTIMVRVDPGLLRERLKPPVQKGQPLADKLILIPILLLIVGGMGFMAADAARWHWSAMPSSVRWTGCGLLLAALLFIYWIMRTNSFAAPVVKIQKDRGYPGDQARDEATARTGSRGGLARATAADRIGSRRSTTAEEVGGGVRE